MSAHLEKEKTKRKSLHQDHDEDRDDAKYMDDSEAWHKERHDKHKKRSHHDEKKKRSWHGFESDEDMEEKKRHRSSPHHRHRNDPDDSPPRRKRSQSRSGRRDRSNSRDRMRGQRERSRDRLRSTGMGGERNNVRKEKSPSPKIEELNPEQRDLRTVFCMQLSTRLNKKDLLEFFSNVGKVHDIHLIRDSKSHRSKGIAYVEFFEIEAASRALDMTGKELDGIPMIIQPSHGDRNRSNMTITSATGKPGMLGPMKLYIGSLHYNITEDMLRKLFEPFGQLDELKIMRDHQTGRSAGYGFIQYRKGDEGRRALEQLNGYELAGRPIKLGSVADYQIGQNSSMFDIDESDKLGFGMSATSRIQLMAKLAEGTGLEIPKAAANVLHTSSTGANVQVPLNAPPVSSQCLLLSNMFSSNEDKTGTWEQELREEVIEECSKHGGLLHIYVDRNSLEGNIYIKCASIASAMTTVTHLHGRYFAGKVIKAAYIPLPQYHNLFPDAIKAVQLLSPYGNQVYSH